MDKPYSMGCRAVHRHDATPDGECWWPASRAELVAALNVDWAAAYAAGSGGHEQEHEQWVEAVLNAALGVST